jgi:hypothetical protein
MPASSYLEEQIHKAVLENTAFSITNAYVALLTGAPANGKDTAGSELKEPSYAAYARGAFGGMTIVKGGPSGITYAQNSGVILMNSTTTTNATVTWFALMDSLAKLTGHMLHYGELREPLEITPALPSIEFKVGELKLGAE